MTSPLNTHQRHHIASSCQYIDRLLGDVEAAAAATDTRGPFAKYVDDLTPEEKALVRQHCAEIRAAMTAALHRHGIESAGSAASARHVIRSAIGLIDVAAEEMRPQYMRGYGAMAEEALPELQGLATELHTLIRRFDAAMAPRGAGERGAADGSNVASTIADPAASRIDFDVAGVDAELRRAGGQFEDVRKICEAQRDPPQHVLTEAFDFAAERAITALDHPQSVAGGVKGAIRSAVEQAAAS